jgi:hypothetical protein
VRCIFGFESRSGAVRTYEERVTLWRATSDDEAIGLAEESAVVYAAECSASYLGLEQSYRLVADTAHGTEVFSLMRDSDLLSDEYLDRFFDTGTERQRIR